MAATVSPLNEEPCIRASVFGLRLASPRMEGAVVGPRLVSAKKSSASIAGSTMSVVVNAGPIPNRVKRSPQNSVWVVFVLPMGHVGGIDISDFPASDIDDLSVCKHSPR